MNPISALSPPVGRGRCHLQAHLQVSLPLIKKQTSEYPGYYPTCLPSLCYWIHTRVKSMLRYEIYLIIGASTCFIGIYWHQMKFSRRMQKPYYQQITWSMLLEHKSLLFYMICGTENNYPYFWTITILCVQCWEICVHIKYDMHAVYCHNIWAEWLYNGQPKCNLYGRDPRTELEY